MKTVQQAAAQSTCQKRVTVCVILDAQDNVLACESNRCAPDGGTCHRIGVSDTKREYPLESSCNWHHAERRAVAALPYNSLPHRAVLYGHDFYCDACERLLVIAGVKHLEIGGQP